MIDGLNVWLPVGKDCKTAVNEFSRKGWLVRTSDSFDIEQTSQAIRVSTPSLSPETAKQFALDAASIINNASASTVRQ